MKCIHQGLHEEVKEGILIECTKCKRKWIKKHRMKYYEEVKED